MAQTGIKILPETMRTRDSATFTGSYQTIGSTLGHAACLVKFVNNSTSLVTISWDGTNDHDIMPASTFALYDIASDAEQGAVSQGKQLYIAAGTQFYVKGAAGVGLVYLVVLYASTT